MMNGADLDFGNDGMFGGFGQGIGYQGNEQRSQGGYSQFGLQDRGNELSDMRGFSADGNKGFSAASSIWDVQGLDDGFGQGFNNFW